MQDSAYDAVVIGSGPGGVTCAALLAKEGLRTLLVEKNAALGGKMMTVTRDGFTYDLWPHGQVPMRGCAFETVFRELGVEAEFEPALSPDDPREVVGISYRARDWKEYRTVAFAQTLQDATPFFDLWGLNESERAKAMQFLTEFWRGAGRGVGSPAGAARRARRRVDARVRLALRRAVPSLQLPGLSRERLPG